eukprot:TRINITY_DN8318_c0_g1_i1.p1 TRINITY_DN8318_c0_g1~~TRINITY_DN8318_c0_g1_i1.p1  ORF type:complete len:410 (-),score=150.00 TRINITY_DN8318_c0_g1_i1:78-1307(-)
MPGLMPETAEDRGCWEQVLVAAFPDALPEVNVASLFPKKNQLMLREASVPSAGGDISLGSERRVDLSLAGSVEISDGIVAILGRDRKLMVQMHLETEEEQVTWAQALKLVIEQSSVERGEGARAVGGRQSPARSSAPTSPASQRKDGKEEQSKQELPQDDEAELPTLRARSQQLQTRIGNLEAISERRDKQLHRLLKRLDGAMKMLDAVQDMCMQQRKVIDSQKVAIEALQADCGEVDEDAEDEKKEEDEVELNTEAKDEEEDEDEEGQGSSEEAERQRAVAEVEQEMAAKAEQMLALLKQADEMQRALAQLEALEASGMLGEGSPAEKRQDAEDDEDDAEDDAEEDGEHDGDADTEAVLKRLLALEEEKSRFENMLASSQNEQQDLLQRLESMRSLMSAVGMETDDVA